MSTPGESEFSWGEGLANPGPVTGPPVTPSPFEQHQAALREDKADKEADNA